VLKISRSARNDKKRHFLRGLLNPDESLVLFVTEEAVFAEHSRPAHGRCKLVHRIPVINCRLGLVDSFSADTPHFTHCTQFFHFYSSHWFISRRSSFGQSSLVRDELERLFSLRTLHIGNVCSAQKEVRLKDKKVVKGCRSEREGEGETPLEGY